MCKIVGVNFWQPKSPFYFLFELCDFLLSCCIELLLWWILPRLITVGRWWWNIVNLYLVPYNQTTEQRLSSGCDATSSQIWRSDRWPGAPCLTDGLICLCRSGRSITIKLRLFYNQLKTPHSTFDLFSHLGYFNICFIYQFQCRNILVWEGILAYLSYHIIIIWYCFLFISGINIWKIVFIAISSWAIYHPRKLLSYHSFSENCCDYSRSRSA